jgi:nucleotide-binding universal stress UspA family protein
VTQATVSSTKAELALCRFADLVVAYDFSEAAETALKYAVMLAKQFQSSVHLVGVQSPADYASALETGLAGMKMSQHDLEFGLKGVEEGLRAAGIRSDSTRRIGNVADTIESLVLERPPDLLLFGAFGYSPLDRRHLGSTAEHLLRTCRCPSLVIGEHALLRGHEAPQFERILCATSSFEASDDARGIAGAFAAKMGAQLELLHVIEPEQAERSRKQDTRQYDDWMKTRRERGVMVKYTVIHGRADRHIAAHAAASEASVVLFGIHRRGKNVIDCPDGVVSAAIREAPCPVITFPSGVSR